MGVSWRMLRGNTSTFALDLALTDGAERDQFIEEAERASWGAFALWVRGTNLCAHVEHGEPIPEVHWYLLPVVEWLVDNWDALLHEERLPLGNESPTATAALARASYIAPFLDLDEQVRRSEIWQGWWRRHSLRAAAPGALVPDLVVRRWGDHVEFSIGEEPQPGTPDHFVFDVPTRVWRVPVAEVANDLYEAIGDLHSQLSRLCPGSERLAGLGKRWAKLRESDPVTRLSYLAGSVEEPRPDWLPEVIESSGIDTHLFEQNVAVIERPKVLALFGSYAPEVSRADVEALVGLSREADSTAQISSGEEGFSSPITTSDVSGLSAGEQGSILGEEAYYRLSGDGSEQVDIEGLLATIGVTVTNTSLSDQRVRAVSLLGVSSAPLIAVNKNYERGSFGGVLRFTLAHELAHLLLDRQRSRELAIVSGPWAPVDIEQRANAFGAAFLMPEALVRRALGRLERPPSDFASSNQVARLLGVSLSSLADRMRNLGLLSDEEADALKGEVAYRRKMGDTETNESI